MKLKAIESRQTIDTTTFSFGAFEKDDLELYNYQVFCAGSGIHHVDKISPVSDKDLKDFITQLKRLKSDNFKKKVKLKTGWLNICFKFYGFDKDKGIKVTTYLSGFLFLSTSSIGSYISQQELDNLTAKLEACVAN